ncbi:MAG: helix-turn-helix transcriptional regulator [Alphaproteobacteria bacterium]|nr:helix-turn-helix transcriptional regulator [Alphaproteobacteria bacterium]MBV9370709.1 helix-turn-helix transcriptional regulator [Alphaproteobacteria bacterium]MBV9899878.1 helix-turn-helix transcriptional regulator [Alphaproteobacteria bacterium]
MGLEAIDETKRAAIRRLTLAERECLRRCLSHQTAKQMALDLGISPHAVEKRLKMARAKLGLSSSLEAAKLVESLERSGRLGPRASDLPSADAGPNDVGSVAAPRNETARMERRHRVYMVSGAMLMSFFAAAALMIWVQSSGAVEGRAAPPAIAPSPPAAAPHSVPAAGTEAALRRLVAGLASGSPDYDRLSPPFAEIVRRDLPMTHRMFGALGELKSMTFRGRGPRGDDAYDLVFANGAVRMSAALDAEGRMAGGILEPAGTSAPPAAGTEAALRSLVAGLASGSPDYDRLAPPFAEIVRRDLPMTHRMFGALGELKSVTFRGRRLGGDDAYDLVFANGAVTMSAALDAEGRMAGGILQPADPPRR